MSAAEDGRGARSLRALDVDSDGNSRRSSVADLSASMDEFVDSNGWYDPASLRPQTARNLAMSLMIEAGELLECFQWSEDADPGRLEDEVADVVLYLLQLSRVVGIDPIDAAFKKLERNRYRTWDADLRAKSG